MSVSPWPLLALLLTGGAGASDCQVRVATFNVALNFPDSGGLARELAGGDHERAKRLAAIIQHVRPDVLLLNEVDHDPEMAGLQRFVEQYLAVGQDGQTAIEYPEIFHAPVNTGVATGLDLDGDGETDRPGDAHGFGRFPGQYGMAVVSRLPLQRQQIRTFQTLEWNALPDPAWPEDPETGESYYDAEVRARLRLSSKSHWDIPVEMPGGTALHLLASHPTPPVFDGPEDRNGRRNAAEIGFWADYVEGAAFPVDDAGKAGGLAAGTAFVIAGDLNADPVDGDSSDHPVQRLLKHPLVQATPAPTSRGARAQATLDGGINGAHLGPPDQDTADFGDELPGNLRVDYVLPSRNLSILDASVYWPEVGDPGRAWIDASDHRMVFVDLACDVSDNHANEEAP